MQKWTRIYYSRFNRKTFYFKTRQHNSGKNRFNLSKNGNLKEAANNLYKTMRLIKKRNFKSIAVTKIPNTGIGYAINDRLKKASNR